MKMSLEQHKTTFKQVEGCISGCDLIHWPKEELLNIRKWHLLTYDGNSESRIMVDAIDFLLQRPKRSLSTMIADEDNGTTGSRA